ncbi:MAG: flagellar hook-basal body protein FliE [Rhodobacteraceae bacterium]|nr:MAG: flagellar hook-basal body protein FliE [Paracoccaceae bacterium]
MDVRAPLAGRLYTQATQVAKPAPAAPQAAKPGDFGRALQQSALDTLRAVKGGEEMVKAGLAGRADAHSVVEALAQTELAVETATTLRDKVVEAYNEILRMPV